MKRKYQYTIALSPDRFLEKLYESKDKGYMVRVKGNKLAIRKTRYALGKTVPTNFQVSFLAQMVPAAGGTRLDGRFGAPGLFYAIYGTFYFVVAALLLCYQRSMTGFFVFFLVLSVFSLVLVKLYVLLSMKVFEKENLEIIGLLESIQAECLINEKAT